MLPQDLHFFPRSLSETKCWNIVIYARELDSQKQKLSQACNANSSSISLKETLPEKSWVLEMPSRSFKFLFWGLCLLAIVLDCKHETVSTLEQAEKEIRANKTLKGKELLENYFSTIRPGEFLISRSTLKERREIKISQNRVRFFWKEGRFFKFFDLEKNISKVYSVSEEIQSFTINPNGLMGMIVLSNCNIILISFYSENNLEPISTPFQCNSNLVLSNSGKEIIGVANSKLVEYSLEKSKTRVLFSLNQFPSEFPKIPTRYFLANWNNGMILYSGNSGAYCMYYLQNQTSRLLTKTITIPKYFPFDAETGFLLKGGAGTYRIFEIKGTDPKPGTEIVSPDGVTSSWKIGSDFFYIDPDGILFKWNPKKKSQAVPVMARTVWGIGQDFILYENKRGELVLRKNEFGEEDSKALKLYLLQRMN